MEALREMEEKLSVAVSAWLEEAFPQAFLVEARLRVHRPEPEVYLRVDTDAGITLEECVQIHLYFRERLKELDWLPENWGLSVSSPGVGSPLRLRRQYRQNIGRQVQVRRVEGPPVRGILSAVEEEGIRVRTPKGEVPIAWEAIVTTRVEVGRTSNFRRK
ncbi:MAG: hypothetical protein D6750_03655 [Bacteroidetes bacterium]|nr:MAG: hypothetical protein D6750_03655 [Bacteroidota bacterium]